MTAELTLFSTRDLVRGRSGDLPELARQFCDETPHRQPPFSQRNWGGALHSLCSYQGKLKPAIAHFLVSWFTAPGARVLDPLAGVATIPLEARRLGRVGVANDLSPLASSVARAKLEAFEPDDVSREFEALARAMATGPALKQLADDVDLSFGLNGCIRDYFHPRTLREVVIARQYFIAHEPLSTGAEVIRSSLMHILHGNRPYALSRRSHPVTPFAPTGAFEYRDTLELLSARLGRLIPELMKLQRDGAAGESHMQDFRQLQTAAVDAVITSPPFARSLRFWSTNWMRLWFAGWQPAAFRTEPPRFLEVQQRSSFEAYREFAEAMYRLMKPGALLIMHLGEVDGLNMASAIGPMLEPLFEMFHIGREGVQDTESHGLTDKGATIAHWYLFALRR